MDRYRNCVTPKGQFVYGIHKPNYTVANLRTRTRIEPLGRLQDGSLVNNTRNYPETEVEVEHATWIYEIANPLPFRGVTYIDRNWADGKAADPAAIRLPQPTPLSFSTFLENRDLDSSLITDLPRPLLLTLATCSTDADDLVLLARLACELDCNDDGDVSGLRYRRTAEGTVAAVISDFELFEAVANNPALPHAYKQAMVLRPGAQGASEIVGDWHRGPDSHIYEYLRRNSYIAGGHFAANMADDAVRYSIFDLTETDMRGLRHLYYRRIYCRLAAILGLSPSPRPNSAEELEELRVALLQAIDRQDLQNYASLWGWNFGFDYTPTDYRLHASHQQIHQQYALVPELVDGYTSPEQSCGELPAFSSGDMVKSAIADYRRQYKSSLFHDYARAIAGNTRLDGRTELQSSLVVWEDERVVVFVPKAQTSQWELQIMTKTDAKGAFPGNVLEADLNCRASIDVAILKSQQALAGLGARMVTSIEYGKRIADSHRADQPLLYSLLPKLPYSPGAFSEAQLRFINGHYPEDFALACRKRLDALEAGDHDS